MNAAPSSGRLLQDMLELLHNVARLKSIPGLRDSQDLPEAERSRGADLADRLTVPILARTWQMLLKGVGEVEIAPDRRAAVEMVLIRLCHLSDTPTPGDLVRRLLVTPTPPVGTSQGGGGMARAAAKSPSAISVQPIALTCRCPGSFREVVALVGKLKEVTLHAHLLHSVHLVRFEPPVIEIRPEPEAPRDLAPRLASLLSETTNTRWTIAISAAAGEPTIAEQGGAAETARKTAAADHPLVRAILAAFPGAQIDAVNDTTADAYGLAAALPRLPDVVPYNAEYLDDQPMEIEL